MAAGSSTGWTFPVPDIPRDHWNWQLGIDLGNHDLEEEEYISLMEVLAYKIKHATIDLRNGERFAYVDCGGYLCL